MCQKLFLKLYVSGNTIRSQKAINNLKTFCQKELIKESVITVIDITKNPEIAEEKKILITPTLVRELPLPQERVIGDLSDAKVLALILNTN